MNLGSHTWAGILHVLWVAFGQSLSGDSMKVGIQRRRLELLMSIDVSLLRNTARNFERTDKHVIYLR